MQPYSLTYNQAVEAAKTIAQRKGFGVVIMRRFDRMAHADDVSPGADTVISFPVDRNGLRLDWPTAWRIRNTLTTR